MNKYHISLWSLILSLLLALTGCNGASEDDSGNISSGNETTYRVTYEGNGNSGGGVPVDNNGYQATEYVTVPGNPGGLSRNGYHFVGWNTRADGDGSHYIQDNQFAMPNSDMVLYAQWSANPTYTLSYHGNGNTGGAAPQDSVNHEEGSRVTILGNSGGLIRQGYSFIGWNSQSDGSGSAYQAGEQFTMGSVDVILYAQWSANSANNSVPEPLGFELVDTGDYGLSLQTITQGSQVDLATLPGVFNFTVEFAANPGSVKVDLVCNTSSLVDRYDNSAIYTVAPQSGNSGLTPADFSPGSCTLSATPYELADLNGEQGTTLAVDFSIIDTTPSVPVQQPIAVDDQFVTTINGALNDRSVADNDTVDTAQAIYSAPSATASGGVLVMGSNGSFSYTPPQDVSGSDSFVYEVVQNSNTASATVTIQVIGTDDERVENCPAQAPSRCWFASPQGGGTGDFSSPGTVNDLIPKLSAGDYLYLFGGVYKDYFESNGNSYLININKYVNFSDPQPTESSPVTISGYANEEVIIQGDLNNECILVDGVSHVVFQKIIVEYCFSKGMRIGSDVPETDIRLNNMEFRNIEYYDDSGFIYVHSYTNVVIENSKFHDYIPKPVTNQTGSYIKLYRAIDVTVRNNDFFGVGSGIYYKHGEASALAGGYTHFHNNTFRNLSGYGISTNQNRTEIYSNLFMDNEGVLVHQEDGSTPPFTRDVDIHNNTFIDSGVVLRSGSNDGSYMGATGLGAKYARVTNNLFVNSQYEIWPYGSNEQYNEGICLTSDENCFSHTSGNMLFQYFSSDTFGNLGDSYILSDWQSLGYDINSLETSLVLSGQYLLPEGHVCQGNGW